MASAYMTMALVCAALGAACLVHGAHVGADILFVTTGIWIVSAVASLMAE